ncbi:MAG: 5-formyltetrahydrofolate cyclo-ligase [Peptococcales bacterium]
MIRKNYKELRQNLSPNAVMENSKAIFLNITKSLFWQEAQVIMCYLPLGNEVNTKLIIENAWAENKQVVIPVCQAKNIEIIPSLLTSFDDLEPRTMGILEPKDGKLHPVDPTIIQLALIPGVAFDLKGHRIGFGAGYYDRFLPKLASLTPKIALAHEIQISPEPIPSDEYDILMDYICTEKKLYKVEI